MHLRLFACLACASLLAGCPDNTMNPPPIDFGGTDGAADMPQSLDGPTVSVDLGNDVGGPTIVVNSPAAGSEVVGNTLGVSATITAMAGAILASDTVQLIVPSSTGAPVTVTMSLTGMPNVYAGTADISAIPTGMSNFFVTAKDTMGRASSVEVKYVHNRGPQITFLSPTAPTAKGSTTVDILVVDPLGHNITSLVAGIRQPNDIKTLAVVGSQNGMNGQPLHMSGTLDFNTGWTPPLDGPQLIIATAVADTANKDSTGKTIQVQVQAQKAFTVDNAGPTIVITNPTAGSFVGGVVEIKATVTDISGVVDASVQAVFGNDPANKSVQLYRIPGGDVFHGFFDVRQFGLSYVLPSLSVRADDRLGNHGELGIDIIVDNTPPHVEMDPVSLRIGNVVMGQVVCSREYDPVGSDAANDGDTVPQVITLRARIEDDGNRAPGLAVVRYAGLDPNSVYLYVASAANGPIVVDSNASGHCDSINPKLVPISMGGVPGSGKEALALQLQRIPSGGAGAADFTDGTTDATYPQCNVFGKPMTAVPPPLCSMANTTVTYVLPHPDKGVDNSAIFSIPPYTNPSTDCVGFQLDSQNLLPEGPLCAAVIARDNAGNINVSPPLRICLERSTGHCAGFTAGSAPNCTGTYNKATDTVSTTTPCTPLTYGAPSNYSTKFPAKQVVIVQ